MLLTRLEDEVIESDVYTKRINELNQHRSELHAEIIDIESILSQNTVDSVSFDIVYQTLCDFKKVWSSLDYLQKKEVINLLVHKVTYSSEGKVNLELYFLDSICSRISKGS